MEATTLSDFATRPSSIAVPGILAVLNASQNSISGNATDVARAGALAMALVVDGAAMLDVGGQSLRTDEEPISTAEEIARLLPVVEAVRDALPDVPLSVDTYRPEVLRAVLEYAPSLVNDPSGLHSPDLCEIVAEEGLELVLTFNSGPPKVRRPRGQRLKQPFDECREFFLLRLEVFEGFGIPRDRVVLDPGPDLWKAPDETIQLLRRMGDLRNACGVDRVLWAVSRKDFVGAVLGAPPSERAAGSLGAFAALDVRDQDLVRVHDPKATREFFILQRAVRDGIDYPLEMPESVRYNQRQRPQDIG